MPTKEEFEITAQRRAKALEMLCGATPRAQIARLLQDEFGCSRTAAYRDIQMARRELPKFWEWKEHRRMISELLVRLDHVVEKALAKGALHAAVRALREQAELLGLNSARQVARERDTLRGQLEELRSSRGQADDAPGDNDAPLEQINYFRSLYGQPPYTPERFEELRASGQPAGSRGGNGVN